MKPSELPKGFLDIIPEEFRSKVISRDCINLGMIWSKTPQGDSFWGQVHRARSTDDLPPLTGWVSTEEPYVPVMSTKTMSNGKVQYTFKFINSEGIIKTFNFMKSSITNCGLCLFEHFNWGFPPSDEKGNEAFRKSLHLVKRHSGYPHAMMTHNHGSAIRFEGLEIVHSFKNPNSSNTINIYFI